MEVYRYDGILDICAAGYWGGLRREVRRVTAVIRNVYKTRFGTRCHKSLNHGMLQVMYVMYVNCIKLYN